MHFQCISYGQPLEEVLIVFLSLKIKISQNQFLTSTYDPKGTYSLDFGPKSLEWFLRFYNEFGISISYNYIANTSLVVFLFR